MGMRGAWMLSCLGAAAACAVPELFPEDEMAALGAEAWQEIVATTPQVSDPEVRAFVEKVARRVVAASELRGGPVKVAVFASNEANAFALPGGYIGIYSGMLPFAQNSAGLAAILAHEVAHITAHHANQRMSQQALTELVLSGASGALQSSEDHDTIMAVLGLGSKFGVELPYSRDQEAEADELGLFLMAQAGYLPEAAVDVWRRMQQAEGGGGVPEFVSTHPAIGSRIESLERQMPAAMALYRRSSPRYGEGEAAPGR